MARKKNATRADSRKKASVYLGIVDGKKKYKYVYGRSQKELDAKIDEVKLAIGKGLDVTAEPKTFREWAEKFLAQKSFEVSRSQSDVYDSAIDHLNRYIGDIDITKIKSIQIQEAINGLARNNPNTNKPAAKRTLEVIKNAANQVFRLAIENRIMEYNPVGAVKIPRTASAAHRRALTDEEQKWILNTYHDRAQRAAMIMMYAGLRRGELIPLLWNDIDLKEKTIRINKAVERVDGKFEIKHTAKTAGSIRVVHIPQQLVDYLKKEKRESIYVCVNSKKEMHTVSSFKRMWESYLADLNIKYGDFSPFEKRPKSKFDPEGVPFVIPHITPHWLRHTFATILYMSGVDVREAMEQLGHTDIKTTLGIYTHLDKAHKVKSINKMEKYLDECGSNAGQLKSKMT